MTTPTPWIVKLACPFCSKVIVSSFDATEVPADLYEEMIDRYDGNPDANQVNEACEHLAFFCDWGGIGNTIEYRWSKEMVMLADALVGRSKDTVRNIPDEIAEALLNKKPEEVASLIDKVLHDYDHHFVQRYIEMGDGPKGGGPTYKLIFLKKK